MKKILPIILSFIYFNVSHANSWEYNYSITANSFYGYTDYNTQKRYNHNKVIASAEIYTDVRYSFSDDTYVLLGLDAQISGAKEIEDYNHGEWGENIYLSFNSTFGEFSLGQLYNAAYQMAVGAPNVGYFRVNNSPVADFIINHNWQQNSKNTSFKTLNSTFLNTDGEAFKFIYTSPEYKGTKLSVSYTPDNYSQSGLINKHTKYDNKSSYAVGLYNLTNIANYEIETSLGYAYNHKNNQEISAGFNVYYKGWTLGSSYRQTFTSSNDYAFNENIPYLSDAYRKGQAFNVGIKYEFGPLETGISYFSSHSDISNNRDNVLTWSNKFAFHKYVSLYFVSAYAKYRDEYRNNDEGYAFISGLEINI